MKKVWVIGLMVHILVSCSPKENAIREKATEYQQNGIKAIQKLDFSAAEESFKKSLELDPQNPNYKNNLAVLYAQYLKQPEKAAPIWEELLEETPNNSASLNNLAGVYRMMGKKEKAIELYERAKITSKNSYHMPYYNMGKIYTEEGNYDKAREELYGGLSIAPNDTMVIMALTKVLMIEKKYAEAEALLKNQIKNMKGLLYEPISLMRMYETLKKFDAAEEIGNQSLAADPQNLYFLAERVLIALLKEEPEAKIRERLATINTEQDAAFNSWFPVLIDAGIKTNGKEYSNAITLLDSLQDKIPEDWTYYEAVRFLLLSKAYSAEKDQSKADEFLKKANSLYPEFFPNVPLVTETSGNNPELEKASKEVQ